MVSVETCWGLFLHCLNTSLSLVTVQPGLFGATPATQSTGLFGSTPVAVSSAPGFGTTGFGSSNTFGGGATTVICLF